MDSFLFSVNATLPLFLIMSLGYFLKRLHLTTPEFLRVADKLVFKVTLPVMLFLEIAKMDISQDFDWLFCLFCAGVTTVMFLGTWGLSTLFLKDKSQVGSFAMCSVRCSAAILGAGLAANIYGEVGLVPLMIVAAVPLFNVYSVIILTVSGERAAGAFGWALFKKVLRGIVTNPIILGIVAGLPFALFSIPLPELLTKTANSVGSLTTPLALLVIGAGFDFKVAATRLRPAVIASVIKLVLLPAVFLPLAVWLGFRDTALIAIFIMLAAPTTVSCYIMAGSMKNDAVLAANTVMLTTLFSSVTLTAWLTLLRALGWV